MIRHSSPRLVWWFNSVSELGSYHHVTSPSEIPLILWSRMTHHCFSSPLREQKNKEGKLTCLHSRTVEATYQVPTYLTSNHMAHQVTVKLENAVVYFQQHLRDALLWRRRIEKQRVICFLSLFITTFSMSSKTPWCRKCSDKQWNIT